MRVARMIFLLALLTFPSPTLAQEYARADSARSWSFPRDHGSHPEFQTEWWYVTGSVRDEQERPFGYELTFFRFALRPSAVVSPSPWRARDLIIAHLGVSEIDRERFHMAERTQRAAAGLAGASEESLGVWIGDWSARQDGDGLRLEARAGELGLSLRLDPGKGPVLHGEGGRSPKDAAGSHASYYYSMPRLATSGRLRVEGQWRVVQGSSWMDHEFFTGSTPVEGLGWDWFSARLEDGRDLMLYRVRPAEGEPFAFGTLVERDGRSRALDMTGLVATPLEHWSSEASGVRYPVAWRLELPAEDLRLQVKARMPQQELRAERSVGFAYWEGLSRYEGRWGDDPIRGEGYVELTGY